MKTTMALIIKFAVTLAAAWICFTFFSYIAFYTVPIIAVVATVVNYLLGDQIIFRYFGNVTASICDGILSIVIAYLILRFSPVTYFTMTSIYIFGIVIAIAEAFFHVYLVKSHLIENRNSDVVFQSKKLNYNTETGSELYPYSGKLSDKKLNSSHKSEYKRNNR
jgi:hypothetical protein